MDRQHFLDACVHISQCQVRCWTCGRCNCRCIFVCGGLGSFVMAKLRWPCPFRSLCGGRILDGIWWCIGRRMHNWCGPIGHPQPQHCANHGTFGHRIWRIDHTPFGGCYSIDLRIRWTRYHTAPTTGRVISAVNAPLVIPTTSAKG